MKTTTFTTPGILPLEALTTMGVSSKPNSSNPIGQFGTGLKYAFAILARERIPTTLTFYEPEVPNREYYLTTEELDFRGQPHTAIFLESADPQSYPSVKLPFTTHLGSHWTLANAFRELESNTRDEGGVTNKPLKTSQVYTEITIHSQEFASIPTGAIFLASEPLASSNNCEVHQSNPLAPAGLYYRGVLVDKFTCDTPPAFTYNILSGIELTEDRTARYTFQYHNQITAFWCQCSDKDLILKLFRSPCSVEQSIILALTPQTTTKAFHDILLELDSKPNTAKLIPMSLRFAYRSMLPQALATLSPEHEAELDYCLQLLVRKGFTAYPVEIASNLPDNLVGLADRTNNTITLTPRAFQRGTNYLLSTLLEETIHLQYSVDDYTRHFQDITLDLLANTLIQSEKN